MENKGIERLVERIKQQDKIPRKSKKLLPYVAGEYIERKQLDKLKLTKKSRNFAKKVYYILDQILKKGLEKPCGYAGKHLLDVIDSPELIAEITIKYCIQPELGLKPKLIESAKGTGVTDDFIKKRYIEGNKRSSDKGKLIAFGTNQKLYLFMMDYLLNNKKN